MQQKEFEMGIRQTLPVAVGVDNLIIENGEASKMNFHGIRYTGRILCDFAVGTDQFASGMVTLMCIPNEQITTPILLTEADLNDSNSFIIATEAWSAHTQGSGAETGGFQAVYDFEFAPKTSRSCMRGGRIIGQITNSSPGVQAIVTHLLSTFESV